MNSKCRLCGNEAAHIHTDMVTYVMNGFSEENNEAKVMFDKMSDDIKSIRDKDLNDKNSK